MVHVRLTNPGAWMNGFSASWLYGRTYTGAHVIWSNAPDTIFFISQRFLSLKSFLSLTSETDWFLIYKENVTSRNYKSSASAGYNDQRNKENQIKRWNGWKEKENLETARFTFVWGSLFTWNYYRIVGIQSCFSVVSVHRETPNGLWISEFIIWFFPYKFYVLFCVDF